MLDSVGGAGIAGRLWPLVIGLVLAGCGGEGSSSPDDEDDLAPPPSGFALEGAISIEANTRVDGDTADLLAFGGSVLKVPQVLPSTFILAGYISAPPVPGGQLGNFETDKVDRFQVPFVAGEEMTVATFATFANSLESSDLPETVFRLRDLDEGGAEIESVTIPAGQSGTLALPPDKPADSYLVELVADTTNPSPIRYVMAKLGTVGANALSWDWPRFDYLPGKAMVSLDVSSSGAAGSRSAADPAQTMSQSLASPDRKIGDDLWLMRMPGVRMASAQNAKQETLSWIKDLRKQPGVASAVPDYVMSAQNTPLDEPLFPFQWHYDLIDAPLAWQLAPEGGDGTVVAVLDTGLYFDKETNDWHPDLAGNVLDPLPALSDFIDIDNVPADVANSVASSVFHGTHVAGTVLASSSNNEGGTGLAFNAGLLPVRVLGEGGTGSASGLIAALDWIYGDNESVPPKASIVNLSLGGLPQLEDLQDAIDLLDEKNVILVAAAGNQRTSTPTFPAAADKVFSVSAVDGAGNLASYSNFGPWVDMAAPGGDGRRDANLDGRPDLVISASASLVDGRFRPVYTGLQGTSMASPHVAGVFALMKTINPDLNFSLLDGFLKNGDLTADADGSRTDALGYGLIDAAKAVSLALDSPDIKVLSASPSLVNLSSESNQIQRVLLQESGSGSVVVNPDFNSIVSPDWLQVADESNPLSLTLTLIEDKLEPGVAVRTTLKLDYTSDRERTLEIPVFAQVVADERARNAGQHFILLVNEGTLETEAQIEAFVNTSSGQYEFSFQLDDVRPGNYFLVAGTDLDNDGVICQAGEACAEFPVSGLREVIEVDENTHLDNIQMTTGYSRPGISAATPDMLPRPDFSGYRLLDASPGAASGLKTLRSQP